MRLAQDKERYAFLTIGEDKNKQAFLPVVQELHELGFNFYATEGTHAFLEKHHIPSIYVHKMYNKLNPSVEDVLRENVIDLIIDLPYNQLPGESGKDEQTIREWAIKNEVMLVTDLVTAKRLVEKMKKRLVVRKVAKSTV
jgi:carbamoyl-phosphate synthase large subunit